MRRVLWMFSGTLFYRFHDRYGWEMALYISVSVGWAMGWDPPFTAELHNNAMSKLYSSIHVCVGEMFVGVAVFYLAEELVFDTEGWMIAMMKTKDHSEQTFSSILKAIVFKFRIVGLLLAWIVFGILFHSLVHPKWGVLDACDYVISTLTGSGYKPIPADSPEWIYVVSAFYTCSGYPLAVIALGEWTLHVCVCVPAYWNGISITNIAYHSIQVLSLVLSWQGHRSEVSIRRSVMTSLTRRSR